MPNATFSMCGVWCRGVDFSLYALHVFDLKGIRQGKSGGRTGRQADRHDDREAKRRPVDCESTVVGYATQNMQCGENEKRGKWKNRGSARDRHRVSWVLPASFTLIRYP